MDNLFVKAKFLAKISFAFFIFFNNVVFSQTIIKGKVNFDNNEMNTSTIVLKEGEEIISYTFLNDDFTYVIETDKIGVFKLIFSALNFETQSIEIKITPETKKIEKNISLIYKPTELNEVIIEVEKPIKIKNDTIVFDAKSFSNGNEKVIEDLLKKIPGINVLDDGTIKIGNQEIEKVMIEGDDMFDKGYKILTKNMPVSPIDKIELYQNYSNNKHLKGVEKSQKVALNLTLKEGFKRQWFGNYDLSYGLVSENRYELKSNMMNFGKKNKYYFLTNLNNLGIDVVGDINHLIRPYRINEPGSIGDDQMNYKTVSIDASTPSLKQKRVNFNNAELLSLNSIFSISSKIKIKTLGFLNTDEINFYRNSFQSFSVENLTFENYENYIGRNVEITGFGKLDLIYDISKSKTLEYTSKYNSTYEKNGSSILFNSNLLLEKLKSKNELIDQKAVFTNKINESKVFVLSGRYINEKTPQNYAVNQFIYQDLFSVNANNLVQNSQIKMQFAGFEMHLLDRKKNGDLLELKTGIQYRSDNLTSNLQLKNNENILNQPSEYQNQIIYSTYNLHAVTKYAIKFKKVELISEIGFHQLFNILKTETSHSQQKPFYLNPKVELEWNIDYKNKINTSYSFNTSNATILDVYDNYIQTNFRLFTKGASTFNQLESSNITLNYTLGNWSDKFFANSFLIYSKNYDFFSSNSIISQNYSQSKKIIIKDRQFLSFSSNIDTYFKPISANLKFIFGGSKFNYKNIVNNSYLREIKNNSANYGFELRSGFNGFFNYHFGTKWNYNEVVTTTKSSFTNNISFLDFSFLINKQFNLQLQTERYFFGNLTREDNRYYFLDAEARYVINENKLAFSLSGNNLFNTVKFKDYSISDTDISRTEYRLQPRYVLVKMEYRF